MPPELASTYASAADTLAKLLPPKIKVQCDRILGDTPSPHERWTMYDTTYYHLQSAAAHIPEQP
jgi:hypothetical protein